MRIYKLFVYRLNPDLDLGYIDECDDDLWYDEIATFTTEEALEEEFNRLTSILEKEANLPIINQGTNHVGGKFVIYQNGTDEVGLVTSSEKHNGEISSGTIQMLIATM